MIIHPDFNSPMAPALERTEHPVAAGPQDAHVLFGDGAHDDVKLVDHLRQARPDNPCVVVTGGPGEPLQRAFMNDYADAAGWRTRSDFSIVPGIVKEKAPYAQSRYYGELYFPPSVRQHLVETSNRNREAQMADGSFRRSVSHDICQIYPQTTGKMHLWQSGTRDALKALDGGELRELVGRSVVHISDNSTNKSLRKFEHDDDLHPHAPADSLQLIRTAPIQHITSMHEFVKADRQAVMRCSDAYTPEHRARMDGSRRPQDRLLTKFMTGWSIMSIPDYFSDLRSSLDGYTLQKFEDVAPGCTKNPWILVDKLPLDAHSPVLGELRGALAKFRETQGVDDSHKHSLNELVDYLGDLKAGSVHDTLLSTSCLLPDMFHWLRGEASFMDGSDYLTIAENPQGQAYMPVGLVHKESDELSVKGLTQLSDMLSWS